MFCDIICFGNNYSYNIACVNVFPAIQPCVHDGKKYIFYQTTLSDFGFTFLPQNKKGRK